MPDDLLECYAVLDRRYTGPIPPRKLLDLQSSPIERAIAGERAWLRHCQSALRTHSHMTAGDRALYERNVASTTARLAELEARQLVAE